MFATACATGVAWPEAALVQQPNLRRSHLRSMLTCNQRPLALVKMQAMHNGVEDQSISRSLPSSAKRPSHSKNAGDGNSASDDSYKIQETDPEQGTRERCTSRPQYP